VNHLYEARALKAEFPEETKGFTVFEVERIWEEHSEKSAAGWLVPHETMREEIKGVFDYFRLK
jgi:hypothetical protein